MVFILSSLNIYGRKLYALDNSLFNLFLNWFFAIVLSSDKWTYANPLCMKTLPWETRLRASLNGIFIYSSACLSKSNLISVF